MSIEENFDIPLIAALALKEKQSQQNYRPIIAVHKWFARRPGTLFRGLILSEFGGRPVTDTFFQAHTLSNVTIADPFMGGGTPLLEANRLGCNVLGFDINPMAAWIVREEIEHLDLQKYQHEAEALITSLEQEIGDLYRTDCPIYGNNDVPVKYFLWVKVLDCEECNASIDLFPGYLIAKDIRHPRKVVVCPCCGDLNEVFSLDQLDACKTCGEKLLSSGPAQRNYCVCPNCEHRNHYPRSEAGPLRHRLVAIEYYNPYKAGEHEGRFFKKPDEKDLDKVHRSIQQLHLIHPRYIPEQEILPGDETNRLHRWGYTHYKELFNERQLLGLELSCRYITEVTDDRVRHALATNLSDLLRYQNLLCRYDTMALKSLDIFSVHGFPVGLIQCESNLLGITNGQDTSVGSGGWRNIISKYTKAKQYCYAPFETYLKGKQKVRIPIVGEWIGDTSDIYGQRNVQFYCKSSTNLNLKPASLDAVFTDPPYFGNVQYGELMDFCYVWLRGLVGTEAEGFDRESARSLGELTVNASQGRDLEYFAEGLSTVYRNMAYALKPGAPLAFTFHHNNVETYYAVGVAILDAGLMCFASLPCPAEMGGSIHIHGTKSSIVDTVFVCRTYGHTRKDHVFETLKQLADILQKEIDQLKLAGMKPTEGDVRCIICGHLTRMTICKLFKKWDSTLPIDERLDRFSEAFSDFGDPQLIFDLLTQHLKIASPCNSQVQTRLYEEDRDAVSL
jgi:adenine-specific DNA methylase